MNQSNQFVLTIYVAGRNLLSQAAIRNLQEICDNELRGEYKMNVVDILERPQLAEDERILATPAVVKKLPPPLRTIVGDMSDREKVMIGLDLQDLRNSKSFAEAISAIEANQE